MQIHTIITLFLLLIIANGTPWIVSNLLGQRFNWPLDGGVRFLDGRPLLGPTKTLRGLVSAILATTLLAPLFDLLPVQGAAIGLLAMSGDLLSSFLKRRMDIEPSHSAPLLDQLPEALLPLGVMHSTLSATAADIVAAVMLFIVIDVLFSRLRDMGLLA